MPGSDINQDAAKAGAKAAAKAAAQGKSPEESNRIAKVTTKYYEDAYNVELKGRSHLEEDEKQAYAEAYANARAEGQSGDEARKAGNKAAKKRKEDRIKEEEIKKKKEEEEKRQQEGGLSQTNIAANESTPQASFTSGGMMSVNPIASEVGAGDADISEPSESQMENGEIDMVVMFSILSTHDLKRTKTPQWADGLTENLSVVSSLTWEEGSPVNYANKIFKVFDCSHLKYDSVSGKAITWIEMMDCLEAAVNDIKTTLFDKTKSYGGGTIRFSVAGFLPIEALMYAFSDLLGKSLTNSALYEVFITEAKSNFSFNDFTGNGWTIEVDYACIYEVFSLYFERKLYANEIKMLMGLIEMEHGFDMKTEYLSPKDIAYLDQQEILYGTSLYSYQNLREYLPYKQQEELLWYEYQKAARHAAKVQRMEEEYEFPSTASDAAHTFLGLSSIIISPISLIDAGLHAYEWIKDGDESGAHKIGIAIDLVCCIPFVRIAKFLRGGQFLARAAKTGVPAMIGHKAQILYYKGKSIVVKRAIKLSKKSRDMRRRARFDVNKQTQVVEAGKQRASDAHRELSELVNLKTGQQVDDLTIGMLEKELTSGTLSKEMYQLTMSNLTKAREAFARNGQRLAQLQEKEKALQEVVKRQAQAETQLNKFQVIYTNSWSLVKSSTKYSKLVQEQQRILSEIERLQQANQKLVEDALKPWASEIGSAVKDTFKEWATPFSFKQSFNGFFDKEGWELAMHTEGTLQTLVGSIATVYGAKDWYDRYSEHKQQYYDQLEVQTGLPDELIELVLEDGTIEVTSETILELMAAIDELRGTYGYAPNELNGHVLGLSGSPKSDNQSYGAPRYKVNNPSDLYKFK